MKGIAIALLFGEIVAHATAAASQPLPSGEVFGWGINVSGQATAIPPSSPGTVTLFATGYVAIMQRPLTDAIAVAAGDAHALALMGDGTVVGWGWNIAGQATGVKT